MNPTKRSQKDYGVKPCPVCGKTDKVIPIIYGLPIVELMDDYKKGKVKLGGCCVTDDDPQWYCKRDKLEF